jgi:type IV pilus assembly protein PilE
VNTLLRLQVEQEKWRGGDTDYGTLAEIWSGNDSLEGFYTVAVTANTAATYTITAAPKAGSAQQGDSCGTFAVNQSGPLHAGYADAGCWGL